VNAEWFKTTKRVRQGCPLRKAQEGGSVVGKGSVCGSRGNSGKECERKEEMMKSLRKYVRKKKLVKIMVFKKRKRKSEENEWKREGRKIERMREIKYLGYTFNEKTTDKVHMREIVRKMNKVVGCVWGIGERKWGSDFRRRMMIFESMIERNIDVLGKDLGIE
jgi:hypothetical protein